MCIYGMEGPGGYQLFGRTMQVWNTWRQTGAFTEDKPWLLRFFDQIRFFPVSHAELTDWRRDFPLGRRDDAHRDRNLPPRPPTGVFWTATAPDIERFQARRRPAFDAEREAWEREQEFYARRGAAAGPRDGRSQPRSSRRPAAELLEAPLGGNVWKIHVRRRRPGREAAR